MAQGHSRKGAPSQTRLLIAQAPRPLDGELVIPVSKYHAHRALILGSLAAGRSRIEGVSDARHVAFTLAALRGLGTRIDAEAGALTVHGGPYHPGSERISFGSSGSTFYFLTGLAALADRPLTFEGQRYLRRRPVGALLQALRALGVRLEASDGEHLPITVWPGQPRGGQVRIAGTLSQWISGLLLLAPFTRDGARIDIDGELNERTYLRLTVRMMARFGLHVRVAPDERTYEIDPGQRIHPADLTLPPDVGSAAFGLAAAALHPSDVRFLGLTREADHPEGALYDVLERMGVPLTFDEPHRQATIRQDRPGLVGTEVDMRELPDMLPILSVLGAFAAGQTRLRNVAHVRLKESDRVASMLQLGRMGARVREEGDDLVLDGVAGLEGRALASHNDHRVLMALAVAGSRARGTTSISYPHAYRLSYPTFLEAMTSIGIPMTVGPAPRRSPRRPRRPELLTDRLLQLAHDEPGGRALVEVGAAGDRALTWSELASAVDRAAALLIELGVRPGERVCLQLPNWAEFVVICLATLRVGAICCPLMPFFREREVGYILRHTGARILFVPARFRGRDYPEMVQNLGVGAMPLSHVVIVRAREGLAEADAEASGDGHGRGLRFVIRNPSGPRWHDYESAVEGVTVDQEALALMRPGPSAFAQLLFTSGTSGEPKGVLHHHAVLEQAVEMHIRHFGLTAEDAVHVPSPLAHQTGFLYGMWLAIRMGAPQILQPTWDPAVAIRALTAWDGAFVQAATPFLADLVAAVEAGAPAPPRLRIFVAAGAAVPRALATRATDLLGATVCGGWGTTESCMGTSGRPGDPPQKAWGTDGRPLEGVGVRVVDGEGMALPAGSEGEFEIRSPLMFAGYLGHPEWTEASYTPDGWFRTGDLATIDEDGYVRITGRVKDLINRGGEKIPVAEIEQLLYEHPDVTEAAIVAMPDARLGERACAFVCLRPGGHLSFSAMQRFLDGHRVARQYWPERLAVVEALPHTPSGKIQKFLLREEARHIADGAAPSRRPGQAANAATSR
ncbi:MAG TPA: 3-phosphoshikimate 1-carboxyvinyltransferase [Candidatus Limnocylindrales bacterium]|nr:3-phosphoshikimate 1-carboxyvinyltransferase [Candidatus Limnocylindrales bacterium]